MRCGKAELRLSAIRDPGKPAPCRIILAIGAIVSSMTLCGGILLLVENYSNSRRVGFRSFAQFLIRLRPNSPNSARPSRVSKRLGNAIPCVTSVAGYLLASAALASLPWASAKHASECDARAKKSFLSAVRGPDFWAASPNKLTWLALDTDHEACSRTVEQGIAHCRL